MAWIAQYDTAQMLQVTVPQKGVGEGGCLVATLVGGLHNYRHTHTDRQILYTLMQIDAIETLANNPTRFAYFSFELWLKVGF